MKRSWTKHSNEKHTADHTEQVFGLYLAKKFVNSDLPARLPNTITTVQLKILLEECMSFSFFAMNGPLFCKMKNIKLQLSYQGHRPDRPSAGPAVEGERVHRAMLVLSATSHWV